MSNTIKIKRGSGTPAAGALSGNELGWDFLNKSLYIGVQGTNAIKISDSFGNFLSINQTTGDVTFASKINVSGLASLSGGIDVNEKITLSSVNGNIATVGSITALNGTFNNNLTVLGTTGLTITNGDLNIPNGNITAVDCVINGDLTVHGTTTTNNSLIETIANPVFIIGETLAVSDHKDRGIVFNYGSLASPLVGFFGLDESTGRFTFIPNSTNISEVFSGDIGDYQVGQIFQPQIAGVYNAGGILTNVSEKWNNIYNRLSGSLTSSQYDLLQADSNGVFQPTKTIVPEAGITIDCGTY